MKRTIIAALASCAIATPAFSVSDINKDYIKSLAAPGKTVLVLEYYDGSGKVADRKGYATTAGFKAVSPTDFRVDDKTTLHLFGLEPCKGEMVNRNEDFAGRLHRLCAATASDPVTKPEGRVLPCLRERARFARPERHLLRLL